MARAREANELTARSRLGGVMKYIYLNSFMRQRHRAQNGMTLADSSEASYIWRRARRASFAGVCSELQSLLLELLPCRCFYRFPDTSPAQALPQ